MPPGTKIEFRSDDDSFYLFTMKDGKEITLRIDLRIFPKALAVKKPLGLARENPNMEPYLPPPVGRIEFSLNPFKMLAQLVGPEFLAKIYGIICLLLCCTLCIFMAPMILSNFGSTILMKMFGIMWTTKRCREVTDTYNHWYPIRNSTESYGTQLAINSKHSKWTQRIALAHDQSDCV